MEQLSLIANALELTLKSSSLKDLATGTTLGGMSGTVLETGTLTDIPAMGAVFGLSKASFKVADKLLLKKLIEFAKQLKDVPIKRRNKRINDINKSEEYDLSLGEKLLYIIDRCEDPEKAKTTGKLFKGFLNDLLNYDEFLRFTRIIEYLMLDDLKRFMANTKEELPLGEAGPYLVLGLYELKSNPLDRHDDAFDGAALRVGITDVGRLLIKTLDN